MHGPDDYTYAIWPVVICSQFVQAFSVITACIPYMKPFFSSLESGMIRSDDSRRLPTKLQTYEHGRSTVKRRNFVPGIALKSFGKGSSVTESASAMTERGDALPDYRTNKNQDHQVSETASQGSQARMIRPASS